jgi:hypothetical protein
MIALGRSLRKANLRRNKMPKSVNLDFSKFFPKNHSFVSVRGVARHGDDFTVNLSFGDGEHKVTYYVTEYNTQNAMKQMQAMLDSLEKAMEFVQKATAMPRELENPPMSDWFKSLDLDVNPAKKPAKKKAASKK